MCENHEAKPVDEKPAPEIRGGNRPTDYLPDEEEFEVPGTDDDD
jgi:hypothetical protein